MEVSIEYKSRCGFADFENKTFQITNKKSLPNVICKLIKVPEYTYTNTYTEKICEGNGWYSKGKQITEQITQDFYWLVVLENKCLGVINKNEMFKISLKYAIQDLKDKKHIKSFMSEI